MTTSYAAPTTAQYAAPMSAAYAAPMTTGYPAGYAAPVTAQYAPTAAYAAPMSAGYATDARAKSCREDSLAISKPSQYHFKRCKTNRERSFTDPAVIPKR